MKSASFTFLNPLNISLSKSSTLRSTRIRLWKVFSPRTSLIMSRTVFLLFIQPSTSDTDTLNTPCKMLRYFSLFWLYHCPSFSIVDKTRSTKSPTAILPRFLSTTSNIFSPPKISSNKVSTLTLNTFCKRVLSVSVMLGTIERTSPSVTFLNTLIINSLFSSLVLLLSKSKVLRASKTFILKTLTIGS